MKKPGTLFLAVLLIGMLVSGCGAQKEAADSSQGPDSTAQSQKTEQEAQAELPTAAPSYTQPASSPSETSADDNTLIIGEKMFLTQINDIFYNFDLYKDKTIVVEGMYTLFFNQDGIQDTPAVYRRGPGCCGNDGWGGFLLRYDGDYPEDNAWIKVTGTPELVENGHFKDLWLNVTSIEILEERGEEFVSQ